MAKASRSKKQPAFDPSELDDLIFSPAIGKGVGSHLIADSSNQRDVNMTTVVDMTTMASMSTVDNRGDREIVENSTAPLNVDVATVDSQDMTTEVVSSVSPVAVSDMSAVVIADMTTEAMSSARSAFWITENGDPIADGRVRQIHVARDVINPGEQAVYDALWNAAPVDKGSGFRIVQVGYDYLMKQTALAKKTIQRVIDKLLAKDFITIERSADIYRRTPTVYRVYDDRAVLERHVQRGRTHVAKIGPGFSYVQRFSGTKQARPL